MYKITKDYRSYLLLIVILGAALRLPLIFHDFEIDEIYSFDVVHSLKSPTQIFTNWLRDTNHPLNTLFMYQMKNVPLPLFKYRILSIISGVLTIFAAYLLSLKIFADKNICLLTSAFVAASFPLAIFSSIAKGYGPLVFFSVASLYLLLEYISKRTLWSLILFNFCYVCGFLSHLTFVFVAVGLLASACAHLSRERNPVKEKVIVIAKLFFIPTVAVFLVLGRFAVQIMAIGAATRVSLWHIPGDVALAVAGQSPPKSVAGYALAIVILFILIREIKFFIRSYTDAGVFIITAIVAPVIFLSLKHYDFIYTRYFLYLFPFLLMLFAHFLYRAGKINSRIKAWIAVMIGLIFISNLWQINSYFKGGKRYRSAVSYLSDHSGSADITISGDNDVKNLALLYFYNPRYGKKNLRYLPNKSIPQDTIGPEWFIVNLDGDGGAFVPKINFHGSDYIIEKDFCIWRLYHRVGTSRRPA